MCIAIYKPSDKFISKETLQICFKNNPHGCGFSYINNHGDLVTKKHMEFEGFYKQYQKALSHASNSPFLIHFRWRTHGETSTFNCHPFQIDQDHVFIHNGTIALAPDCPEKRKSDTQMFNEAILQNLPEGWFYSDPIKELIENYIKHSKLVVMNRKGEVSIYNEKAGFWVDGIWFSNEKYKEAKTYTSYGTTSYYSGYSHDATKGYTKYEDGSWRVDGNLRRTAKDGEIEQWDPIRLNWFPWDVVTKNYIERKVIPLLEGKRNTEEITYDCGWCGRVHLKETEVALVQVDGAKSFMCQMCHTELQGVENLKIKVGFRTYKNAHDRLEANVR